MDFPRVMIDAANVTVIETAPWVCDVYQNGAQVAAGIRYVDALELGIRLINDWEPWDATTPHAPCLTAFEIAACDRALADLGV